MNNKKTNILILILLMPLSLFSQNLLSNEEVVYYFKTQNGKEMTLAKDKKDKYIVYRFGAKNKTEFEFPTVKDKSSWKKFTYSFYLRGGGKQNDGMDLNYILFENKGYKYLLFYEYFSKDESIETAIKITNLKTKKQIKIGGKLNSRKGTLIDLRDNNLITITDDLQVE